MGDRALVVFTDRNETNYSPVVYLHWGGSDVLSLLEAASPRMRTGDVCYSAARFIGVCHEQMNGHRGLGIFNSPTGDDAREVIRSDDFSHGDAGVFLANVDTWIVQAWHGYGFGNGGDHPTPDQPHTMPLDASKVPTT